MSWREKLNIAVSADELGDFRLSASRQKKLNYCKSRDYGRSSNSSTKQQIESAGTILLNQEKVITFEPLKINQVEPSSMKNLHLSFKDSKHLFKQHRISEQIKSKTEKIIIESSQLPHERRKSNQFNNFPVFNIKNIKDQRQPNLDLKTSKVQQSTVKSLEKSKINKQPPITDKQKYDAISKPTIEFYQNCQQKLQITKIVAKPQGIKQDSLQLSIQKLQQSLSTTTTGGKSKKKIGMASQFPYHRVVPQSALKSLRKQDFKIGRTLGKGQYGQVKIAIHKQTGFLCAMKIMPKKVIVDEGYVNQIVRQITIHSFLHHRNIAPLYGFFDDKQNLYLLLEFCSEGQLFEKIKIEKKMSQQKVSRIIKQVLQGLQYLHKLQIIHRDIKPQNVLFNNNVVKLSDFGWAVYHNEGFRKTVSGSPLYYPPEIVKGDHYDEKIDLWNVGMMTYECLLGKIPFRIYSQLDLNKIVSDQITFPQYVEVSDVAKDFILKTMRKNPQQRMQIRQMLQHEFITKFENKTNSQNEVSGEDHKKIQY